MRNVKGKGETEFLERGWRVVFVCFVRVGCWQRLAFLSFDHRASGSEKNTNLTESSTLRLTHRHTEELSGFVGCVRLRGCDAFGMFAGGCGERTTHFDPRLGVLGVPAWRKRGISRREENVCVSQFTKQGPCERRVWTDATVPTTWIRAPAPAGAHTHAHHVTF